MYPFRLSINHRALRAMVTLCSTDLTRYTLNRVMVEMYSDHVRLVATDGRRMGILNLNMIDRFNGVTVELADLRKLVENNKGKPVRLWLDRNFIRETKPGRGDDFIHLVLFDVVNCGRKVIVTRYGGAELTYRLEHFDTIPNYFNALPATPAGSASVDAFGLELATGFTDVAHTLSNGKSTGATMRGHALEESTGRKSHVYSIFLNGVTGFYGLLMPVHDMDSAERVTPTWLHPKPPAPVVAEPFASPSRIEPAIYRLRRRVTAPAAAPRRRGAMSCV